MSTIKADNLTGKTTAGDVTVTSEGGAATFQLQQGLVKQWHYFNHATTTVNDSFNVSSITDVTTGQYDPQTTNNMSAVNYSIFAHAQAEASNSSFAYYGYSRATGSHRRFNYDNGAGRDEQYTDGALVGDLA